MLPCRDMVRSFDGRSNGGGTECWGSVWLVNIDKINFIEPTRGN